MAGPPVLLLMGAAGGSGVFRCGGGSGEGSCLLGGLPSQETWSWCAATLGPPAWRLSPAFLLKLTAALRPRPSCPASRTSPSAPVAVFWTRQAGTRRTPLPRGDPRSREKWTSIVTRVPGGGGRVRPSLLLGTPLSPEPQMPWFPRAPRSPHGSQAHRPWLCHPLRAQAPPLLGIGRTVVPWPQTLPALGTWASLARGPGRDTAVSGILSKCPLATTAGCGGAAA